MNESIGLILQRSLGKGGQESRNGGEPLKNWWLRLGGGKKESTRWGGGGGGGGLGAGRGGWVGCRRARRNRDVKAGRWGGGEL